MPARDNNRPKVYDLFLPTEKLPLCAQEKGHSLLVLLVTAAANLQSAPSPPAGTSPHYSHDRGRDMLSCAWFGPAACTARPKEPMQDAWFFHCVSTGSLVFPTPCNDITCSMQRLLCFDTDGFVSRTAVAQWNSHARTVLDFIKKLQHGVFRKPIPNWTAFCYTECQFRIASGIAVWSLGEDPRSSLDSDIPALLVKVLRMLHCMMELRAKRRHATQPPPTLK